MTKVITVFSILILLIGCEKEVITNKVDTIIVDSVGKRLDSTLTPYIENLRDLTNNTAALAIGITQRDKIIYARTFGYANIQQSIKADFNTIFHIASVSKPFTAAAVVQLIEEEKLQLDDYLVDILPEFKMKGDDYKKITIQQMLTHTSGIPRNISSGYWENPIYGSNALQQNLEDIKELELDFEPGTKFNYSNAAFDILGIVISRVSGMSFEEYVKKAVLIPSGMTQSQYLKPKDNLPKNWAVPYSYGLETQEWSPYPYTENYLPSSGLQTTLSDMCRWGLIHVNRGKYQEQTILSDKGFSILTQPRFDTPWGDKIGLSWFLQSYLERPIIMHTGNDTGFESLMYVYPEDSISITVLANRDFARTARIINAASEILFNGQAKDYEVSAKYRFSDVYNKDGLESAVQLWEQMKNDTTDIYFVEDEAILTTGAILENGKKWKEAQEILTFYTSMDSSSTYSWRLLGNTYLQLGDTAQAKECYKQTLKINPNYEKGRKALEALGKF